MQGQWFAVTSTGWCSADQTRSNLMYGTQLHYNSKFNLSILLQIEVFIMLIDNINEENSFLCLIFLFIIIISLSKKINKIE